MQAAKCLPHDGEGYNLKFHDQCARCGPGGEEIMPKLDVKRNMLRATALLLAAAGLTLAQTAPKYAVDLSWPKPLQIGRAHV